MYVRLIERPRTPNNSWDYRSTLPCKLDSECLGEEGCGAGAVICTASKETLRSTNGNLTHYVHLLQLQQDYCDQNGGIRGPSVCLGMRLGAARELTES